MKSILSFVLIVFSLTLFFETESALSADDLKKASADEKKAVKKSLRLMTFNIRYDNPRDGKNRWSNRKEMVTGIVLDNQVDIVGMQEVLHRQLTYLEKNLPDYAWFGVGRDDGKTKGEYSPVFYNKKRFTLLKSETFWLSKTPEKIASKDWDAAITRIATWGKFRDKNTDKEFILLNTHFDHRGAKARHESAKLIASKIKQLAKDLPIIVMGDFNSVHKSKPYTILSTAKINDNSQLHDSRSVSKTKPVGPNSTANSFKAARNNFIIDHIFISTQLEAQSHKIIDKKVDGRFPSDHFPVLIETTIK